MIQNDVLGNARAEGLEQGRVEGRAEGRAEGEHNKAMDIAKNLKKIGIPVEQIINATGLTKDEIDAIM